MLSSSSSSLRFWTSSALPSSSSHHHHHHRRHFPSSSSSSSSSRRTTLFRTHAASNNNNDNENNSNKNDDENLKAKLKSFAREMNITDPNDFVDMKQGTGGLFNGGKENNAAKNQIREDEQRALNAVTSAEFTKAMLGVTVGLLALYLIIGPPPVEAPLYR
jgi:hypothetical protein